MTEAYIGKEDCEGAIRAVKGVRFLALAGPSFRRSSTYWCPVKLSDTASRSQSLFQPPSPPRGFRPRNLTP